MPKIKTKSGAKKRFKVTGTGKVLFKSDGDNIKKYFLPNG